MSRDERAAPTGPRVWPQCDTDPERLISARDVREALASLAPSGSAAQRRAIRVECEIRSPLIRRGQRVVATAGRLVIDGVETPIELPVSVTLLRGVRP